jgi:hypothetical protein
MRRAFSRCNGTEVPVHAVGAARAGRQAISALDLRRDTVSLDAHIGAD